MAKLIKKHRGLLIKETSSRDNTTYKYQVATEEDEVEWECDSLEEAIEWSNCY